MRGNFGSFRKGVATLVGDRMLVVGASPHPDKWTRRGRLPKNFFWLKILKMLGVKFGPQWGGNEDMAASNGILLLIPQSCETQTTFQCPS